MVSKQTLTIKGMHCASCVYTIEKALKNIDGVTETKVNLVTGKATVSYQSEKVSHENLITAVAAVGYRAEFDRNPTHLDNNSDIRDLRRKLIFGGIFSFIILFLTYIPLPITENLNLIIQFILATPVQFYLGQRFYSGLILLLKYQRANMDTLIAVGTLSAYFYSVFILLNNFLKIMPAFPTMAYFDTGAVIITLVLLGKYLEEKTKVKTQEAIKKLVGLSPKTAIIELNGKQKEVAISQIKINDILIVKPGEKIPTDGEVVFGEAEIDESMITGEATLSLKKVGDKVFGATINVSDGVLKVKAQRIGEATLLAQIIKLVEEAQASKIPIQNLADKISAYFVPAVLLIALLTFLVWFAFGPSPKFVWALLSMISVLIVACPCALGLATPTALVTAIGRAAKEGILIKSGQALQLLPKAKIFVFDKTGTITQGKPEIVKVINIKTESRAGEQELINLAASIEKDSHHPLAQAILKKATQLYPSKEIKTKVGLGVVGWLKIDGGYQLVYVGNETMMKGEGMEIPDKFKKFILNKNDQGETVILVACKKNDQKQFLGVISLADQEKEGSQQLISFLKSKNIKTILLTGDKRETAQYIGQRIGFQKEEIIAEVLPTDKQSVLKNLKAKSVDQSVIAMVGDGINDAAALSLADISIAMGHGSDIAIESGDLVIVGGDIKKIKSAYLLSQKTFTIIYQNFFWAFIYNIVLIPVAAGILYPFFKISFNPIWSALAMAFSSVSVVTNSLRIKNIKL